MPPTLEVSIGWSLWVGHASAIVLPVGHREWRPAQLSLQQRLPARTIKHQAQVIKHRAAILDLVAVTAYRRPCPTYLPFQRYKHTALLLAEYHLRSRVRSAADSQPSRPSAVSTAWMRSAICSADGGWNSSCRRESPARPGGASRLSDVITTGLCARCYLREQAGFNTVRIKNPVSQQLCPLPNT